MTIARHDFFGVASARSRRLCKIEAKVDALVRCPTLAQARCSKHFGIRVRCYVAYCQDSTFIGPTKLVRHSGSGCVLDQFEQNRYSLGLVSQSLL